MYDNNHVRHADVTLDDRNRDVADYEVSEYYGNNIGFSGKDPADDDPNPTQAVFDPEETDDDMEEYQ